MKTRSIETTVLANGTARAVSVSAYPSARPFDSMEQTRLIPPVRSRSTAASASSGNESLEIALDRWENEGGRVWRPGGIAAAYVYMEQE